MRGGKDTGRVGLERPFQPDSLNVSTFAAPKQPIDLIERARAGRKASPLRSPLIDDDYSGFAGNIVAGPRRGSKCADARCRNADTAVNETGVGEEGIRIGFLCDVPLRYVIFGRHGGRGDTAGGDQSSRLPVWFYPLTT